MRVELATAGGRIATGRDIDRGRAASKCFKLPDRRVRGIERIHHDKLQVS